MLRLPLLVRWTPIVTVANLQLWQLLPSWKFVCLSAILPMLRSHSQDMWRRGCWRSSWSLSPPPSWWWGRRGWRRLSTAGSCTSPWKDNWQWFWNILKVSHLSMKWMLSGCVNWLLQIVIFGEFCSKDWAAFFIESSALVRKWFQRNMKSSSLSPLPSACSQARILWVEFQQPRCTLRIKIKLKKFSTAPHHHQHGMWLVWTSQASPWKSWNKNENQPSALQM